jgi:hypothetical protein
MAEFETQEEVNVIVIRDSGAVRGRVEDPTKTPWVIVDENGKPVKWTVLAYPRCLPLVFESRDEALEWAEKDDSAKYFDLDFLTPLQVGATDDSQAGEKRTHESLSFYSQRDGGGLEYKVPAVSVLDWGKKQPPEAGIPPWTPRSYRSTGKSYIRGHNYADADAAPREIPIGQDVQANLPFEVLDSASTTS